MTRRVIVGRIKGAHGLRGLVRVDSYMETPEDLLQIKPWHVVREDDSAVGALEVNYWRANKQEWLVGLEDYDSRERAESLAGTRIEVDYAQLPQTAEGEYYWIDLIGLEVKTTAGIMLGRIDRLFETGANNVIVVVEEDAGVERLVPYIDDVVVGVDLDARQVTVDWDPDY